MGLKINITGTKIMFSSLRREQQVKIRSEVEEAIRAYIYIGQVKLVDQDHEHEITRRIRIRRSSFGRHLKLTSAHHVAEI